MMRVSYFSIIFLLLGINSAAQELVGIDRTFPGTLASFEVVPVQEASWHIVTPSLNTETYQVDSGLSKLYFACSEQGRYTVIAGIVVDGKPKLLVKTFYNGEEEERKIPLPIPPISSLETWIRTQVPVLVRSEHVASEVRLVGGCFEEIVSRIDAGNIKTAQNAWSQLQITVTGTLALASPTAVTDWTPFIKELSRQLEHELDNNINNLAEVKRTLQRVGDAMKTFAIPKDSLEWKQEAALPNVRLQGTRPVRNLLSR